MNEEYGFNSDKNFKPAAHVYEYTVGNDFSGSVGDYLRKKHNYSGKVLTCIMKEGQMLLNDVSMPLVSKCRPGDTVSVTLAGEAPDCEADDIPLDVIFEDNDILVINKDPFTVVHPTRSHMRDTLAGAVYNMWLKRGYISKIHFVSRLDMNTSGIIVIAKNKYVHHFLQSWFEENKGRKIYYAITDGEPPCGKGVIEAPIAMSGEGIKREVNESGKMCVTEYELIKTVKLPPERAAYTESGKLSLIKLKLLTGRTHQIRVHLKHIGLTIVGDGLYGGDERLINRQALHCGEISFLHPRTEKPVKFNAELPEDMKKLLAYSENSGMEGVLNDR